MTDFIFEQGPIRPPSEAGSLLIRLTRGCHWNKCYFCGLYKKTQYSVRSVEDVQRDIKQAALYYDGYPFTSCFLQDGDAFLIQTDKLLKILITLKENFPTLKYITTYARATSITRKSLNELTELNMAGLNHLYRGIETGSDTILQMINKGISSHDIIKSGLMAKEAGYILSDFILLGIGGKKHSQENAVKTAKVLNIVQPNFIRVHATGIKMETELGAAVKTGLFELQSEEELIIEQKLLISKFGKMKSYYMNEHAINLLMEVNGNLATDKQDMLAIIDRYLNMPTEDKLNFALGRRLNYYYNLDDMNNINRKRMVRDKLREIQKTADFTYVCNHLRALMI